jgi:hypothetical protein
MGLGFAIGFMGGLGAFAAFNPPINNTLATSGLSLIRVIYPLRISAIIFIHKSISINKHYANHGSRIKMDDPYTNYYINLRGIEPAIFGFLYLTVRRD